MRAGANEDRLVCRPYRRDYHHVSLSVGARYANSQYKDLVELPQTAPRMSGVRWRQPLPMWARIVCVLFGLANTGGAIAQASDLTFPGVVVGAVWALFGWKGLPLIALVPRNELQQEGNIARGIEKLRRRRLLAFLVPFVWLALAA